MMIITRTEGQEVMFGDDTSIEVLTVTDNFVAIGITTPTAYRIVRLRVAEEQEFAGSQNHDSESDCQYCQ